MNRVSLPKTAHQLHSLTVGYKLLQLFAVQMSKIGIVCVKRQGYLTTLGIRYRKNSRSMMEYFVAFVLMTVIAINWSAFAAKDTKNIPVPLKKPGCRETLSPREQSILAEIDRVAMQIKERELQI